MSTEIQIHKLETYDERVTFAHVLVDAEMLWDAVDVLAYFDRPWRWEPEYQVWREVGGETRDAETTKAFQQRWNERKEQV